MSIQGNYLKAIADAIREKDGTSGNIKASTFPDRIRSLQTGESLPDDIFEIELSSADSFGSATAGIVSGGGYASKGVTITVEAEQADGGAPFVGWCENSVDTSVLVSRDKKYTFQVSSNLKLIAVFTRENVGGEVPPPT